MNVGALVIVTIPTEAAENTCRETLMTPKNGANLNSNSLLITKNLEDNKNLLDDLQSKTFQTVKSNNSTIDNCKNVKIDIVDLNDDYNDCNDDKADFKDPQIPPKKSWENIKDIMSSARRNSRKKKDSIQGLDIPETSSQEIVLIEILKKLKIDNYTWTTANNGKFYQIIFTIKCNEKYELLLHKLNEWGIGDREGSSVSILNCSVFNSFAKDSDIEDVIDSNEELNAQKQTAWNRFMNSMNARLNVAQIVRDVKQEAAITFDFIILAVSAAILASFGLVESSTIFLASSMLISPLMGPIIAAIFGTVIKEHSLRSLGVVNELIGIFIATFVGFCFGLIVCSIDERYDTGDGLTSEMLMRCQLHSVIVGILTAIPSGAAAAVGILGGNIGSLVGVAISASILPPAVNSGLLWALASISAIYHADENKYSEIIKTNSYSDIQAIELGVLGLISMCITITNIFFVYTMGILVLKVKEIAPVTSSNCRQFWKHDIKIARDFNKNSFAEDSVIANEIAALHKDDQQALGFRSDMFKKTVNLDNASYQHTWSPISNHHLENDTKMKELERIYLTVTRPYSDTCKFTRLNNIPRRNIAVGVSSSSRHILTNDDQTYYSRRAAMPFDGLRSPNQFRSSNVKLEPMAKITEQENISKLDLSLKSLKQQNLSKKNRKFIVTPVNQSLLEKE